MSTLVKRLALVLAAGSALSGCAAYVPSYAPPYAAYDAPYSPYGYGPTYVGPPVSLDFSYREYRGDRGWHGHHRGRGRWR